MSTNINISVGDNKLLNQAKLQQTASRQAQLEKEANKRLSNEAEINRVNAFAAQGKDANGNAITAPGTGPKPLRDEPAAFRVGAAYPVATGYLQVSTTTYVDPATGTSQTDKTIYKIYSGDGSTFLNAEFEHPRFPLPALKWGLPSYDYSRLFGEPFLTCGIWSPGYTLENTGDIRGVTNQCGGGGMFNYNINSLGAYMQGMLYRDEFLDAACTQPTGRRLWNNSPDENQFAPGRANDNWLWWQTGPTFTPAAPHTVTKKFTWSYGPYIDLYCLPVSNDSFIVYLSFVHYKYFHYYGQKLNFTAVATSFGLRQPFISQGSNEFFQIRYYKPYYVNGATVQTGIKEDEFDELYEEKRIYNKAFLVTPTTVKEVTVPAGLIASAKTLHTAIEQAPNWSANRPIDTGLSYQIYNKTPTGAVTAIGSTYFPVLTTTNIQTVARYGYNTSLTISQARPRPTVSPALLNTYGLGELKVGGIPGLTFSPATFALLENGTTIRALTNGDSLLNYETVASTYMATYPLTKIFIDTQTVTENGVDLLKFPYTKQRPVYSYSLLPANVFKENKVTPTTVLTNKGFRITVWNWTKNAFCNTKLLGLGFSPSDLTP